MSVHLWSVESLLADIKKMASDDLYNCKLFTVEKDGKSLKLKERQLTTSVLAQVFCLFPETIIEFLTTDMSRYPTKTAVLTA